MRTTGFKCNVCGIEKKETNHWFVITVSSSHGPMLIIETWCTEALDRTNSDVRHICGEACVNKTVSEWLSRKEVYANS